MRVTAANAEALGRRARFRGQPIDANPFAGRYTARDAVVGARRWEAGWLAEDRRVKPPPEWLREARAALGELANAVHDRAFEPWYMEGMAPAEAAAAILQGTGQRGDEP